MKAGPRVRCKKCDDVIQSFSRHDFKWCKCNSIAVDGGADYFKMCFDENSEYKVLDKSNEEEMGCL